MLWRSIEAQDDDAAFKAFIDLGEHRPKLLRSQLEKILDMMLKVSERCNVTVWNADFLHIFTNFSLFCRVLIILHRNAIINSLFNFPAFTAAM